jgi:hypothetical protein
MSKRVMIIGALVTCLVSIVGATAAVALSIGGISVSGVNSVEVASILKALKNADVTEPAYEVVMFLQRVSIMCKNPAGEPEVAHNGRPFNLDNVVISQTQTSQDFAITKNGRALSEIVFSDTELLAAADAALGSVCNENWTERQIVVNAMQVFGTLFSCAARGDPNDPRDLVAPFSGACVIADALGKQCDAPAGLDLFNTTFEYNCETICAGGACPQPPEELAFP